jgi:hypothetical protein
MFSNDVLSSDIYLEMPEGVQNLYIHLNMNADDDGFVTPRRVMRQINAVEDSLKILIAKGFVILFESGVVVIRHWREHNTIRHDRYNPTRYHEEKKLLGLDRSRYYMVQGGNQLAPTWQPTGTPSKEVSKEVKGVFSKEKHKNANSENAAMKSIGDFVRGGFKHKK